MISTPGSTYFELTDAVQLDANGNGIASLGPPSGNYWNIRIAQVSTRNANTPVPYCGLYKASPGPIEVLDTTSLIDDTSLGSGDTTGMLAGTVVQSPDRVYAQFIGGQPNTVATLKLYGNNYTTPPGTGFLPDVPGDHFFGKPSTEVITSMFGVAGGSVTALAPGTVTTITAAPLDMRRFQGYYLSVFAALNGAAPANPLSLVVQSDWLSNLAGTANLYNDGWEFWPLVGAGAFPFSGDALQVQDNTHGPYLSLSLRNTSAAGNIDVVYNLFGTNHSFPGQSARQRDSFFNPKGDGILLGSSDNIAGGATVTKLARYGHGPATLSILTAGQPNLVQAFPGTNNIFGLIPIYTETVPANTQRFIPLSLPKRSIRINVTNTGGVAAVTQMYLINEYPNNG
jgi:hypothetical protein